MFGKDKKDNRFIVKDEQTFGTGTMTVLVDTETGVNYLMNSGMGQSRIIPLLDSEGNVLVDHE